MGMPKAWLQLGAEYLLQHMVRIVSAVVKPIVVAGRAEQNLPPFPGDVAIAHDIAPGLVSLRNVNDPDTLAQMRRDGKPPSP